jgi:uncharacterized phiE125 gp8 family phage protein
MATFLKRTVYTGVEPITLTQAKDFLKVSGSDDDTYITELISNVRDFIEEETSTALVNRTYTETFDRFPSGRGIIELQMSCNITTMTVIYYKDNAVNILDNTKYRYVVDNGLPKVEPVDGWITDYDNRIGAIQIQYTATPTMTTIDPALRQAMYLLIAHWYDNRSAVTYGNAKELPIGYNRIIRNYKNTGF